MRNGQLKPGYTFRSAPTINLSPPIAFIKTHRYQNIDSSSPEHRRNYRQKPNNVTADAGYGSEQNYQWLENNGLPLT